MNTRSLLVRHVASVAFLVTLGAAHVCAQPTIFDDATNDIAAGISTGGGTLDIVKMEVVDTLTDVVFTMTVNGNLASTDWGNFMIGIANQKTPGTTTGNGWGRPINLNAGVTNGVTNGMTHWIGSWVNGSGGSQLWTYNGATWQQQTATPPLFGKTASAQSTVAYTVSKASLGVTNGDTIIFDAYSSGGGGGDSAVDALSNPTNSITAWNGAYTSSATNTTPVVGLGQTRSYTLANTALNVTTSVTFSVDMKAQIAIGTFNPLEGDIVSAYWGADRNNFIDLTDPELDGIYTGTASVSAPNGIPVPYYYEILPSNPQLPLIAENVSRNFTMQSTPLVLDTVFFNNAPDYRNVTFTVDMNVQVTLGAFNPSTQSVEVRGPFNNWLGTTMTAQGSGLYSATVLIGGAAASSVEYKYFTAGPGAAGYYESIAGNRSFLLAINEGGLPNPPQELPTVFFSNQSALRNVTFSVDMSVQQALGLFDPATGVVELRGIGGFGAAEAKTLARVGTSLVYEGTFALTGDAGSSVPYKFYSSGINYFIETDPANPGYEIISQADPFENRTITLGPANVAQPLPLAFFSNQLFGVLGTKTSPLPDSSLAPFSATQGTPSAAQTVTISGLALTSNISATATTGFEVSSDGLTYGPTADILPTAGAVTAASLFVRIAGSVPAGALTNRVSLTSSGSQSTSLRTTGTVTAAANGYSNWLTNYPTLANTNGTADPDGDGFNNNLEFSFDGNPTIGTPSLMTVRPAGTNAVFNWVQRTSGVGYEVQKNNSLTNAWAEATGLSISNSTNQTGLLLPADYIRREFTVPASGKDFYRVRATITNN